MAFLVLEKKPEAFSNNHLHEQGHSRSCSLKRENPGVRFETRGDSRNSFFENETIFVFITPRSWAKLTLKKHFS